MKDYDFGKQRVWYKAALFAEGLVVTGLFFRPDGTNKATDVFTEHQDGVYSVLFNFDAYGRWGLLIYEDGSPAEFTTKSIGY